MNKQELLFAVEIIKNKVGENGYRYKFTSRLKGFRTLTPNEIEEAEKEIKEIIINEGYSEQDAMQILSEMLKNIKLPSYIH